MRRCGGGGGQGRRGEQGGEGAEGEERYPVWHCSGDGG